MNAPTAEIQTLTPGAILEFFELDATGIGGSRWYFHCGTNKLNASIVWQGITYQRFPIEIEGVEITSKGTMPRPTVRVSSVDGVITAAVRDFDDLVGAKVTRRRTLAKYLDEINFPPPMTNPTADPTAGFDDDVFVVERKTKESPQEGLIEFELSSPLDMQGVMLPRRPIQSRICWWHDASDCIYSVGGLCLKRIEDCKVKWGTAKLPFGGFPGAGQV
jgi:lambda family phage minor tail protein L